MNLPLKSPLFRPALRMLAALTTRTTAVALTSIPLLAQDYTLTVDLGLLHQEIDGFGAASAWYDDEYSAMPAGNRAAFIDAFFDAEEGLGLTVYRMRIMPEGDDEPEAEPYFNWSGVRAQIGAFAREVQDRHDPFIMASCWTPPAYMKTNDSRKNGGWLLNGLNNEGNTGVYDADCDYYDDYARWLSLWIQGMQSEFGVTVDALSFQNEPGVKSWESCQWQNDDYVRFFRDHLVPTLIADGLIPPEGEPEGGLKLIVSEDTAGPTGDSTWSLTTQRQVRTSTSPALTCMTAPEDSPYGDSPLQKHRASASGRRNSTTKAPTAPPRTPSATGF